MVPFLGGGTMALSVDYGPVVGGAPPKLCFERKKNWFQREEDKNWWTELMKEFNGEWKFEWCDWNSE